MNAAEITDKLGLHSLRNRAWVCFSAVCLLKFATLTAILVYPINLRYFRRWSL